MNDGELIAKLESDFGQLRQRLGFNATFEALDEVFFFRDFVSQHKFVSNNLARMLSARISETFNSWVGHLHAWVVPNPGSMINVSEHNHFSEEEKQQMIQVMHAFMVVLSKNTCIGITKDQVAQKELFDEAIAVWHEHKMTLERLTGKAHTYWVQEAKNLPQQKK